MKDKKLRNALGVYGDLGHHKEIITDLRKDIRDLNIKLDHLFYHLGLEYQTECQEDLPKIIKKENK